MAIEQNDFNAVRAWRGFRWIYIEVVPGGVADIGDGVGIALVAVVNGGVD